MAKKTNQFINLEAQVDSDKELSDDEDLIDSGTCSACSIDADCHRSLPPAPLLLSSSSTTSLTAAPSPGPSFLLQLVGQIHTSTSKKFFPEAGHNQEPEDGNGVKNPAYAKSLVLCTEDWGLWWVKCKPSQEYFLIYELMMKH
ncbi:hypothetical protein BT96DRAFT_1001805 [Gymnopus androsaceus JB14]|uniref:Uncharacterized protein n=1 Tax=Gymnopus androsaceus JB14 TaxID=1447944 RepID=A0A6A4GZZ7_9AGAR|nr:hypothetical protein BT96DRAFT_1001805 [Gymnopus androsaceus JB14]